MFWPKRIHCAQHAACTMRRFSKYQHAFSGWNKRFWDRCGIMAACTLCSWAWQSSKGSGTWLPHERMGRAHVRERWLSRYYILDTFFLGMRSQRQRTCWGNALQHSLTLFRLKVMSRVSQSFRMISIHDLRQILFSFRLTLLFLGDTWRCGSRAPEQSRERQCFFFSRNIG